MNLSKFLPIACLVGALAAADAALAADAPASKPNIVIILVDDMGFSDIGCYGSEIPTPNLDKLAAEGLRFTQFYNTGRCCPTRAALLTGLYSHQAGVGHMTEDKGAPGYRGYLNDRCVTIAEVLRPAGYATLMTGKWHVGMDPDKWPTHRGFDHAYGSPSGGFYFNPGERKVFEDDKVLYDADHHTPPGWYSTDAWTDFGIKFVDGAIGEKKPFFLYLAYNAPHFPLQAPPEDIAKYRGKYKMGWDALRDTRHAREKDLGVVDPSWTLSPRPPIVKAWDSVSPTEQDRFDHIMAIYAACIDHLDRDIGKFVDHLKEQGTLDNTLIMFMSDNGANAESGPNGKLEGKNPGAEKSTVFEGQSWATASNTPFRRYKHFNHEGGIATPLIVHWPAVIKTPGASRQVPGHVIDMMATCVDVAGAKYPEQFNGKAIQPMEGRSLVPAFDDKPIQRDALYWEHEGNRAIRVGDWKLVAAGREGPWELYDMKVDRTELHDLSSAQPERAKALADQWEAWAKRANVKPYPGKKGEKEPGD